MAEQREFTLFDYFADTEDGIAEIANVLQSYQEPAAVAGKRSFAYDVGAELKGARKHLALLTKFSTEWYAELELDPSQAFEAICKDELLGEFPPALLRDLGYTSEAAYAVKMMWDRVSQRPEDDPKHREYFVHAIEQLKLVFAEAFTEEQFRCAYDQLREQFIKGYWSMNTRELEKDPELMNFRFWLSLGSRFKYTFSSFGKRGKEPGFHQLFQKAFVSDEGKRWQWAEPKSKAASQKNASKERWERKIPEEVVRLSQEPSGVNKPEDLLEHYGYRGAQFGKWVDDAAGRYHVLCSGNAHSDLAKVLEIPRTSLSFFGRLGIAFGARGSGSASAHYEPDQNLFNFTKHRGGGSTAHEWAHALDFNLYSLSHDFMNGKRAPLSGNSPGDQLPRSVFRAFERLMKALKEGDGLLEVKVPEPIPQTSGRYKTGVLRSLERNDYDITEALAALKGKYRLSAKQWNEVGFTYCQMLHDEGREVPLAFFVPTDSTAYYLDAKSRGAYWRRDHELFARAFEAWIEDELAERGLTNSYLVCGTRFGGPYPQGVERETINDAFRSWWRVLLDTGILQDEQLWKKI